MPAPSFWTEDKIAQLRALCASDAKPSAARIADAIGTTRSAIIGKCHRMGIALPVRPIPMGGSNPTPVRIAPVTTKVPKPHQAPTVPDKRKIRQADTTPLNIPIVPLGWGQCHYPVAHEGQHLFCGQPIKGEGTLYCAAHHKLTHERHVKVKGQRAKSHRIYIPPRWEAA